MVFILSLLTLVLSSMWGMANWINCLGDQSRVSEIYLESTQVPSIY